MGEGTAREIGRREVLSSKQQKPSQVYCLNPILHGLFWAGSSRGGGGGMESTTPL